MNRFTSVCLSAKHKTLADLLHLISVRTMTACHWPKPATLVISIIDMYTMISMANDMLATLSISMAYAMLATLAREDKSLLIACFYRHPRIEIIIIIINRRIFVSLTLMFNIYSHDSETPLVCMYVCMYVCVCV